MPPHETKNMWKQCGPGIYTQLMQFSSWLHQALASFSCPEIFTQSKPVTLNTVWNHKQTIRHSTVLKQTLASGPISGRIKDLKVPLQTDCDFTVKRRWVIEQFKRLAEVAGCALREWTLAWKWRTATPETVWSYNWAVESPLSTTLV